jgi:hypothetical protein
MAPDHDHCFCCGQCLPGWLPWLLCPVCLLRMPVPPLTGWPRLEAPPC